MEKEALKKLSTEELIKKLSHNKVLGWLLLGVSIAILIMLGEKSNRTGEFDYMELIIPLCCLSSLPFLWQELKAIKQEIASRK